MQRLTQAMRVALIHPQVGFWNRQPTTPENPGWLGICPQSPPPNNIPL